MVNIVRRTFLSQYDPAYKLAYFRLDSLRCSIHPGPVLERFFLRKLYGRAVFAAQARGLSTQCLLRSRKRSKHCYPCWHVYGAVVPAGIFLGEGTINASGSVLERPASHL